jgi:hypothetical protein
MATSRLPAEARDRHPACRERDLERCIKPQGRVRADVLQVWRLNLPHGRIPSKTRASGAAPAFLCFWRQGALPTTTLDFSLARSNLTRSTKKAGPIVTGERQWPKAMLKRSFGRFGRFGRHAGQMEFATTFLLAALILRPIDGGGRDYRRQGQTLACYSSDKWWSCRWRVGWKPSPR